MKRTLSEHGAVINAAREKWQNSRPRRADREKWSHKEFVENSFLQDDANRDLVKSGCIRQASLSSSRASAEAMLIGCSKSESESVSCV